MCCVVLPGTLLSSTPGGTCVACPAHILLPFLRQDQRASLGTASQPSLLSGTRHTLSLAILPFPTLSCAVSLNMSMRAWVMTVCR